MATLSDRKGTPFASLILGCSMGSCTGHWFFCLPVLAYFAMFNFRTKLFSGSGIGQQLCCLFVCSCIPCNVQFPNEVILWQWYWPTVLLFVCLFLHPLQCSISDQSFSLAVVLANGGNNNSGCQH